MTDLAPPRRRSYSQLSTYLECPELYLYKYVQRRPEEPAVWTVGGTAFHALAEKFLRGEIEHKALAVWGEWTEAWAEAKADVLRRNPDAPEDMRLWRKANRGSEDEKWWREQGPAMVLEFMQWWSTKGEGLTVLDLDGPMLERQLDVELAGVPLVAIPDAVVVDEHGQVNILDYKSSKDQRGPAGSLQLGVYKAALLVTTGLQATWGLYYMTRSSTLQPRDLTSWTVEHIGGMFSDFDLRERSGEYPPRPGDHCRYCPFRKTDCTYYESERA